jgi:hypothetical protein
MPRVMSAERILEKGAAAKAIPLSQQNRVKVQFWVPADKLEELEAWKEAARGEGVELGPWLHGAANLRLKMKGVLG